MSNPSPVEFGSMTVADIMQEAFECAKRYHATKKGENPTAERLQWDKLELMLTQHFGSTEPFATVHVDGSFAHVAYHAGLPDAGEIPLYRAPQMYVERPRPMGKASEARLAALEEFYATAMAQADLVTARQKEAQEIRARMLAVMQRLDN